MVVTGTRELDRGRPMTTAEAARENFIVVDDDDDDDDEICVLYIL